MLILIIFLFLVIILVWLVPGVVKWPQLLVNVLQLNVLEHLSNMFKVTQCKLVIRLNNIAL